MHVIVYPVIVHNVWSKSGFLSYSNSDPLFGVGMIDFAGSGVVHVTGGFTALIATVLLGPRKGRYYDDRGEKFERPKLIPGHSKSLQVSRKCLCASSTRMRKLCLQQLYYVDARFFHPLVWMVRI